MSDTPLGEGWWLAVDGKYYAPELHPDFVSPPPQVAPPPVPPAPPEYPGNPSAPTSSNPSGEAFGTPSAGVPTDLPTGQPSGPPVGSPTSPPVWTAPADATQQVNAPVSATPVAATAWSATGVADPPVPTEVDSPAPWFQTWWAIIPGLMFCFPVGLILLWTSRKQTGWKVGISVVCALLVLGSALSSGGSDSSSKENASAEIGESTTSSVPATKAPQSTTTAPPKTTVPPTTTTKPPTTTTAPKPERSTQVNPIPLGTEVEVAKGWNLKVNYADLDAGATVTAANQFNSPEEGKKYVLVNVSITNTSDQPAAPLLNLTLSLLPPSGIAEDPAFVAGLSGEIDTMAQMQPGATATGVVAFEVPIGEEASSVLLGQSAFTLDPAKDQKFFAIQ